MNAFLNETNSLWFDTWFLPFYITSDSVHLLIRFHSSAYWAVNRQPNATLKKGKSSLPQAWTTTLQESLGLAKFTSLKSSDARRKGERGLIL